MLARILAVLSLLGLLALAWLVVSELDLANRLASTPVWPGKDSQPFRIRDGQSGSWEPRWEDVPGAECMGLLWLRADPPVQQLKDGTRILARTTPGNGEWVELGPEWDWSSARRVDPRTLQRIDYRVEHAGDQLLDRRCELTVCGNCDSKSEMFATAVRARAVMAGLVFGVPLLTLLGFSLASVLRRRQARA